MDGVRDRARIAAQTGVVAVALALAGAARGAGSDDSLRVGPGQPFATIQAAVDAAGVANTILVYPDTYRESVAVSKSGLRILAQGDGVTVIPPRTAGFKVHASNVTIAGFAIGFGAYCAPGIAFDGSGNVFSGNTLYLAESCPGVNAISGWSALGHADGNTITHNLFDKADIGVVVGTQTRHTINTGGLISDNTFVGIAQTPIAVNNARGFLITGNVIDGAPFGHCIAVGTIDANTVPQGGHTITGNDVRGCAGSGISLYAWPGTTLSDNVVSGNTIEGCGGDCLSLEAGAGATMTGSVIAGNTVALSQGGSGIALVADAGAVISGNLVSSNLVYHHAVNGIALTSTADDLAHGAGASAPAGATGNAVLLNRVETNGNVGLAVVGNDNRIAGNTATDNAIDVADLGSGNAWAGNDYAATEGWAVGDRRDGYGTILHTRDGGRSWTRQGNAATLPDTDLLGVSVIDARNVWVVGATAILRTRDGGASWEAQRLPTGLPAGSELHGIKAVDTDTAFIVGAGSSPVLLQTSDGGANWAAMPRAADVPSTFAGDNIDAADATHVWTVGATANRGEAVILFYDGSAWKAQKSPVPPKQGDAFIGLSVIDARHVWAVGGFDLPLAYTTDGGADWKRAAHPTYPWDMNRVVAVDAQTGWIAGDDGVVRYTTDRGVKWVTGPNLPSRYLLGLTAMNAWSAWVVGVGAGGNAPGTIARTIDAVTWFPQAQPDWPNLNGISFVGARR